MTVRRATDLVREIEDRIAARELGPGDRLPPVREQARRVGLAPNTVAAAYRQLRERGAVVGRGRQGTVVADRPQVTAVVASALPEGVIDAMTGNPDPDLLPDLGPALARAARGPARYGGPMVDADLASLGRAQLAADGIDPTGFTVASGAMDAVDRLLATHLRPGDRVGVEDPGYAAVHQLVTAAGYEAVPVEVDEHGPLPEALRSALARGLEALVVTPRAQNPTGAALGPERVDQLNALLEAHPSKLVIEDDHAGPIAGVELASLDHTRPRWAVVRSVAKSLGPDLRLAMVAGDRETVQRLEGRLQVGPGWVSHLLQRTVAHLLADEEARRQVERAAATYRRRRLQMLELLEAHGLRAQGRSGLHVWVPVSDEQAVTLALLDAGYAVRAGAAYRHSAPPALRITTAALTTDQARKLVGALVSCLSGAASSVRIG